MEKRQSIFGILSTVFTLFSCFSMFLVICVVGIFEINYEGYLETHKFADNFLFFALCHSIFVCILGILLGIIGLFEKKKSKLFSIIGLFVGLLTILSIFAIALIGNYSDLIDEKLGS